MKMLWLLRGKDITTYYVQVELPREPMTVKQFDYLIDSMKDNFRAYLEDLGKIQ